jgi:hypothetical protein
MEVLTKINQTQIQETPRNRGFLFIKCEVFIVRPI